MLIFSHLVVCNELERVRCRLNFTRLILDYRIMEPRNIRFALNYCYFLRKFENTVGPGEVRNQFQEQVTMLVKRHGRVDELLGRLNSKGERQRK